ncbi:uncharacterized protein K02A2.6-like [Lytechinus pictus]|uniref:uncharacterized protein K02A2.6-like n=1 Tax=Lytechinus pictus TaxID=7653 RepID=UPI0030B9F72B
MLLHLQGYDVVIKYKPGREMLLSDAMSRLNPLRGPTIETPVRIDHVMFSEEKIQQEYGKSQTPEPLHPHDIPTRPWQVIATDLFHLDGKEYLLVADIYSKFPIVKKLQHTTSANIIDLIKEIFSEQGTPEKVLSDNGPQYSSAQFKTFAEEWRFTHITSSPRYPQSNGYIERLVKSIKTTMMEAKQAKQDINKALQYLRATPIDHHQQKYC